MIIPGPFDVFSQQNSHKQATSAVMTIYYAPPSSDGSCCFIKYRTAVSTSSFVSYSAMDREKSYITLYLVRRLERDDL